MNYLRRVLNRLQRRTVFSTKSPISGKIEVIDQGNERRLRINGETHSVMPLDRNWNNVRKECWGALAQLPFPLRRHPRILMLGLGGGTAVHLLHNEYRPKRFVVLELDGQIISTANDFFGIQRLGDVELREADAEVGICDFEVGEQFDLIIDDVFYGLKSFSDERFGQVGSTLKQLLAPQGVVIFNRPVDKDQDWHATRCFAKELEQNGWRASYREVKQRWHNAIVYSQLA